MKSYCAHGSKELGNCGGVEPQFEVAEDGDEPVRGGRRQVGRLLSERLGHR